MKNQQGYIGMVVIAFLIVLAMILYPWSPPIKQASVGCVVGTPPDGYEEIKGLPAVPQIVPAGPNEAYDKGSGVAGDPPSASTGSNSFVLIRKDVPIPEKSEIPGYEFLGKDLFAHLGHTARVGTRPEKPGYELYYPTWGGLTLEKGDYSFLTEKMIFFVKTGPSDRIKLGNEQIFLADVYQDKERYEDETKGYKTEDLFYCVNRDVNLLGNVVVPKQDVSLGKDQLQLEWILFQNNGFWRSHCKPAVYLYPKQKQLVNVKVNPRGELSYTDPPYDKERGWTVKAFPNGQLLKMNDERIANNYLYYESKILDSEIQEPSRGWVVRGSKLEVLFDKVLPRIGLNKKEADDFSKYWLKQLPQSQYYFVGLMDKKQRDYLEALSVTPNPDTSIRFSFYFQALDQPIIVEEPEIVTPERKGFTLVDWGGMIKLHKDTPFTCSQ